MIKFISLQERTNTRVADYVRSALRYLPRRAKADQLVALGPNPDPKSVETIVEGSMNTECSGCGNQVGDCVFVGDPDAYNTENQVWICRDCANKIVRLF